jgi:integrase
MLGRGEISRSLGTPAYRRACEGAALLDAEIARLLRLARRAARLADQVRVKQLCEAFYQRILARCRAARADWRATGSDGSHWTDQLEEQIHNERDGLEEEAECMAEGRRASVREDAAVLAREAGLSTEGPDFEVLCFELQRTLIRALRENVREWEADYAGELRPSEVRSSGALHAAAGVPAPAAAGTSLEDAIQKYLSDNKALWAPKTYDETEKVLDWFRRFVGDKAIRDLTRDDCRRFEDALAAAPKGVPKGENVRRYLESPAPESSRLSNSTLTKFLGRLGSCLAYAENEGWLDASPWKKRKRKAPRDEEKRVPVTDADLTAIFNPSYRAATKASKGHPRAFLAAGDLVLHGRAAKRGRPASCWRRARRGRFFGPLVYRPGRRPALEDPAVPVHPQLAELGFIEYARGRQRAGGSGLLFPEVKETRNRFGAAEGAWFGRWIRKCGIGDAAKVFHSLRHTVSHRLKRQGVEQYLIQRILGHADESMSTGRYGGEIEARDLMPVVRRLDFREPLRALFEMAKSEE